MQMQVEQGGVVRDPAVHCQVIDWVRAGVEAAGLHFCGCMESPVKGATSGNTEFLAYFVCNEAGVPPAPQMPPRLV